MSAPDSVAIRPKFDLPDDKKESLHRAMRLAWISIFFLVTIIVAIGFTVGSSETMKAVWFEDLLSLVPPIVFLIGSRIRRRAPDEQFPYGYRKAVSLAFMAASLTLLAFGGYILFDAVAKLFTQEHPTIQTVEVFGRQVWMGWLMIAALIYSVIVPVVLGRMKLPLADELHEKALQTDAEMNKADWMTGIAGVLGILGIAVGWWWADSVAAGVIAVDIVKDGLTHSRDSLTELMDKWPTTMEKEREHLLDKVREEFEGLDWVKEADVRLRQEGDTLAGEAFVVPRDETGLLERLKQARDRVRDLDWRLYDIVVAPVETLSREQREKPARAGS